MRSFVDDGLLFVPSDLEEPLQVMVALGDAGIRIVAEGLLDSCENILHVAQVRLERLQGRIPAVGNIFKKPTNALLTATELVGLERADGGIPQTKGVANDAIGFLDIDDVLLHQADELSHHDLLDTVAHKPRNLLLQLRGGQADLRVHRQGLFDDLL